MFYLGYTLKERKDGAGAESWHQRAADAGNTLAMFNLGFC
jgi:TPR repeat protein